MIIRILNEIYWKNKNINKYLSRCLIKCDKCGKEYDSTIINQETNYIKYNNLDLCSGCKQRYQYQHGRRDKQRKLCSILGKSQKGLNWIQKFGEEKANIIKQKVARCGDKNSMYGKNYQCTGLKKFSQSMKGKTFNDIFGEEKTKQIKQKISNKLCGSLNPMYGKPSPQGSGNGWSGWYKGTHYFRSLLELSYIIHLDNSNIKWTSAESNTFAVNYKDNNGIIKTYFPDYYLPDTDEIIEIKPKKLINTRINKSKFSAAKKQFKNFKIVTEDDIKKLSKKDIIFLLENHIVEFLSKYKNKIKEYVDE